MSLRGRRSRRRCRQARVVRRSIHRSRPIRQCQYACSIESAFRQRAPITPDERCNYPGERSELRPMTHITKNRRELLGIGAGGLVAAVLFTRTGEARSAPQFEVRKAPAEWRRMLGSERYHILREAGTERSFTSPLNDEHRRGLSPAQDAGFRCSARRPSSTAARAGRASFARSQRRSSPEPTGVS